MNLTNYEHDGYAYSCRDLTHGYDMGELTIYGQPRHTVTRLADMRVLRTHFRFPSAVPENLFRLWVDLGTPEPRDYGWVQWDQETFDGLLAKLEEHNIEPTPANRDLIRVTIKLSNAN